MLNKLNEILLGDNVVENFRIAYLQEDFRDWLLGILSEVEDCKNLNQDNPWHIYNCLEHILHSVEYMNTLTHGLDENIRRMLAYTMFLHDIGKPECHIRRYSKLYKREIDSFFNHNTAGVKIADRVLSTFGFDEIECEKIKSLINDHDIFINITLQNDGNKYRQVLSKKLILEEIDKLNKYNDGEILMKYLIWVGMSDNHAQNPEMTSEPLNMLGVMETMLDDIILTNNFNS